MSGGHFFQSLPLSFAFGRSWRAGRGREWGCPKVGKRKGFRGRVSRAPGCVAFSDWSRVGSRGKKKKSGEARSHWSSPNCVGLGYGHLAARAHGCTGLGQGLIVTCGLTVVQSNLQSVTTTSPKSIASATVLSSQSKAPASLPCCLLNGPPALEGRARAGA